eukprot:363267-Chlamydomonas_euryale.AAC.1
MAYNLYQVQMARGWQEVRQHRCRLTSLSGGQMAVRVSTSLGQVWGVQEDAKPARMLETSCHESNSSCVSAGRMHLTGPAHSYPT